MKRLAMIFGLLLLSSSLWAEVTIKPPATPVQPGALTILVVEGTTAAEFDAAVIECTPVPTFQMPVTIRQQQAILFQAFTPGKYTITMSLNAWRADLDAAIAKTSAANVKPELIARLQTLNLELATAYPLMRSTCSLEVAGSVPPPPPPPVPTTVTTILLLRESGEQLPEMARLIEGLRSDPRLKGKNLLILDPDSTTHDRRPVPLVVAALSAASQANAVLPLVFGFSADDKVIIQSSVPQDVDGFVKLLQIWGVK